MACLGKLGRFICAGALLLPGCFFPVIHDKIDTTVCELTSMPFDATPNETFDDAPPPAPDANKGGITRTAYRPEENLDIAEVPASKAVAGPRVETPAGRAAERLLPGPDGDGAQGPDRSQEKLMVPRSLLPRGRVPAENLVNDQKALTPLPDIGPEPQALAGPNGHPLSLSELQKIARGSNPLIKQSVANIRALYGAAVQAGLPPNPTLAFEDDTLGTTGGAGYVGGYLEQLIRVGNKLQLARASAVMDYRNAIVALRRSEMDLATSVRTGYFNVLVARENMRVTAVLAEVMAGAFRLQLSRLRIGGLVATYEPRYLRVLALQARADLIRARVAYVSSWKQLAASMGVPGMPLTELAGRVDMPMPVFNYKTCLKRILEQHTDVLTAVNDLQRARYDLRASQISPYPDVNVRVLLQKDYTGPPGQTSPSVAVAFPLPILNWNQGGIAQAQARLVYYSEGPHRVRNDLTGRLAEAYGRYRSNRTILAYYRDFILPDQMRVYNGVYSRYQEEKTETAPNIGDVIVAQQLLIGAVTGYITTLGAMWQAVVDVTDLLQTNELFNIDRELASMDPGGCLPDLSPLFRLPGRHPCAPLKDVRLFGMDGRWPAMIPEERRSLGQPDREPPQSELAPTPELAPEPRKLPSYDQEERKAPQPGDVPRPPQAPAGPPKQKPGEEGPAL